MLQGVLRYLGLDEETRRIRKNASRNFERASVALEQISDRLENSTRTRVKATQQLSRAIRDSEFEIVRHRRRSV